MELREKYKGWKANELNRGRVGDLGTIEKKKKIIE